MGGGRERLRVLSVRVCCMLAGRAGVPPCACALACKARCMRTYLLLTHLLQLLCTQQHRLLGPHRRLQTIRLCDLWRSRRLLDLCGEFHSLNMWWTQHPLLLQLLLVVRRGTCCCCFLLRLVVLVGKLVCSETNNLVFWKKDRRRWRGDEIKRVLEDQHRLGRRRRRDAGSGRSDNGRCAGRSEAHADRGRAGADPRGGSGDQRRRAYPAPTCEELAPVIPRS